MRRILIDGPDDGNKKLSKKFALSSSLKCFILEIVKRTPYNIKQNHAELINC